MALILPVFQRWQKLVAMEMNEFTNLHFDRMKVDFIVVGKVQITYKIEKNYQNLKKILIENSSFE